MKTYLRPKKNGGSSQCSSPDELVGKGRCCHILGESVGAMEITQIDRGSYEIVVNNSKISIQAQEQAIADFFSAMPKLEVEKREEIINFFKEF